ncbi:MAG: MBL fold metallo-hydrolase [Anaerolineae bacterium]|nr:MBL fold metallo-hydrolase [Anaerolineae bacterium]
MSDFTAKFWGARGGYPVPGPGTLEFGGNTTCLEVRAGPHLIVLDAGTGIIGLGRALVERRARLGEPVVGNLLFTHGHHDHTQGLPFFAPFHHADTAFCVYGPPMFGEGLEETIRGLVLSTILPVSHRVMRGIRTIRELMGGQILILTEPGAPAEISDVDAAPSLDLPDAVAIAVHHSANHPKGGSLCYRIAYRGRRLAFATDTEGYVGGDVLLARFVSGVDVLIHDAEYTTDEYTGPPARRQGWGHSTWEMAVQVAQRAGVGRLVLTHHNARHDDGFLRQLEREAQAAFPSALLAREGMTIAL